MAMCPGVWSSAAKRLEILGCLSPKKNVAKKNFLMKTCMQIKVLPSTVICVNDMTKSLVSEDVRKAKMAKKRQCDTLTLKMIEI